MDSICAQKLSASGDAETVTSTFLGDGITTTRNRQIDDEDDDATNRFFVYHVAAGESAPSRFVRSPPQSETWNMLFRYNAYPQPLDANATAPASDVDGNSSVVGEANATDFLTEHYNELERSAELYVMTTVAVVGLLLNAVTLATIVRDGRRRRGSTAVVSASGRLGCFVIILDQFLLVVLLAFVGLVTLSGSLDASNSFGAVFGLVQFVQPWFVFVVATHEYRRLLLPPTSDDVDGETSEINGVVRTTAGIVAGGVIYHVLYLPPMRVLLADWIPGHNASLCTSPYVNLWNVILTYGVQTTKSSKDVFYVVVFCVVPVVAEYVAPFCAVVLRDKQLVDELHRQHRQRPLAFAHRTTPAMVATVSSNVYLTAVSLKTALLTLRLFEFAVPYILAGDMAFRVVNIFANLLIVVRPCVHLLVYFRYSPPIRDVIVGDAHRLRREIERLAARIFKFEALRETVGRRLTDFRQKCKGESLDAEL